MLKEVVEVRPLASCRLYLRFEDGEEGEVDVTNRHHLCLTSNSCGCIQPK